MYEMKGKNAKTLKMFSLDFAVVIGILLSAFIIVALYYFIYNQGIAVFREEIINTEKIDTARITYEFIGKSFEKIEMVTYDWTNWTDLYNELKQCKNELIDKELNNQTFNNLGLDFIVYKNISTGCFYGKKYDDENKLLIDIKLKKDYLNNLFDNTTLSLLRSNNLVKRIIYINDIPYILFYSNVLNSDGTNPDEKQMAAVFGINLYKFVENIGLSLNLEMPRLLKRNLIGSFESYPFLPYGVVKSNKNGIVAFFVKFTDFENGDIYFVYEKRINYLLAILKFLNKSFFVTALIVLFISTLKSLFLKLYIGKPLLKINKITQNFSDSTESVLFSLDKVIIELKQSEFNILEFTTFKNNMLKALSRVYEEFYKLEKEKEKIKIEHHKTRDMLLRRNIELLESKNELEELAYTDYLTGLFNRAKIIQIMNDYCNRRELGNKNFAIVFMDLDDFKTMNDTYGHGFGDEVLKIVGSRLKNSIRSTDFVARFGGDEFLMLIDDIVNEYQAKAVLEKIKRTLSDEHIIINGVEIVIKFSAGIALYPKDGTTVEELLKVADESLYKAKEIKNTYVFSDRAYLDIEKYKKLVETSITEIGLDKINFNEKSISDENGNIEGILLVPLINIDGLTYTIEDILQIYAETSRPLEKVLDVILESMVLHSKHIYEKESEENNVFNKTIFVPLHYFRDNILEKNLKKLQKIIEIENLPIQNYCITLNSKVFGKNNTICERAKNQGFKTCYYNLKGISLDVFTANYQLLDYIFIDEKNISENFLSFLKIFILLAKDKNIKMIVNTTLYNNLIYSENKEILPKMLVINEG